MEIQLVISLMNRIVAMSLVQDLGHVMMKVKERQKLCAWIIIDYIM